MSNKEEKEDTDSDRFSICSDPVENRRREIARILRGEKPKIEMSRRKRTSGSKMSSKAGNNIHTDSDIFPQWLDKKSWLQKYKDSVSGSKKSQWLDKEAWLQKYKEKIVHAEESMRNYAKITEFLEKKMRDAGIAESDDVCEETQKSTSATRMNEELLLEKEVDKNEQDNFPDDKNDAKEHDKSQSDKQNSSVKEVVLSEVEEDNTKAEEGTDANKADSKATNKNSDGTEIVDKRPSKSMKLKTNNWKTMSTGKRKKFDDDDLYLPKSIRMTKSKSLEETKMLASKAKSKYLAKTKIVADSKAKAPDTNIAINLDSVETKQTHISEKTTSSSKQPNMTTDDQGMMFHTPAFNVGDRVRIANVMDVPESNFCLCTCPFTESKQGTHFGKFGKIKGIFNQHKTLRHSYIDDEAAKLYIVIEYNQKNPSCLFVTVPAVNTVNYTLLGEEKANELFNSTCDKELPWQNLLTDDNFFLDKQMRSNIENLPAIEQSKIATFSQIFKEQTHQMYHHMYVSLLSANRETRKQVVEAYFAEQLMELVDLTSSSE